MDRGRQLLLGALCLVPGAAAAHPHEVGVPDLVGGLLHPVNGLDHLVAAIGVGLWACRYRRMSANSSPFVFLGAIALGAFLGLGSIALPVAQVGVMASLLVVGLMVAVDLKAPRWTAAVVVAVFGLFHGYVHGAELHTGGVAWLYVVGLTISSAALIAAGALAGATLHNAGRTWVLRGGGAAIGAVGASMLAIHAMT